MKTSLFGIACLGLSLAVLSACKPAPPPTDEPPEPKAVAATDTALRDAIQAPIDQAKAVEGTVQEAAAEHDAAIDAASQ